MECVPSKLAELITKAASIPAIGIGSGSVCDGQVLVSPDMLGVVSGVSPKFVKRYANLGELMKDAFAAYHKEVQSGGFPSSEHEFGISDELIARLH